MRVPHRIVLTGAAVALAIAPAALAGTPSAHSTAEKQCRQEQSSAGMGKAAFTQTYGTNQSKSNAFGKCVSHRTSQNTTDQNQAHNNAAKECKAQENDPNFATTTGGGKTFDQFYGTNQNGKNAYGKCVSKLAKAKTNQSESSQTKAEDNAAHTCKSQRSTDPSGFQTQWGSKPNAFGKCVSTTARAQEHSGTSSSTTSA